MFGIKIFALLLKRAYFFFEDQGEFEDTKWVIRIRIWKTNRQHNAQKRRYKRTNSYLQNIHIKQKIE